MVGLIQYADFSDGFLSLSNIHLSFFHIFHGLIAHFFLVFNNTILYGCIVFFYSHTKRYLRCFQILAIMNKAQQESFKFSTINDDVSCKFLTDILYQVEKVVFFSQVLEIFFLNGCWILPNDFSASVVTSCDLTAVVCFCDGLH